MSEEKEKIVDFNDQASEVEETFRSEAIASIAQATQQRQKPLPDGSYAFTECRECGGEIGELRLRVAPNNTLCVECASAHERMKRFRL